MEVYFGMVLLARLIVVFIIIDVTRDKKKK